MRINEAAALHFAAGCIADQKVDVGRFDLAGVRVVIDFPDSAAVERSEGAAGAGFDEGKAPELKAFLPAAAILFASRCGLSSSVARRLWRGAILDAIDKADVKELAIVEARQAFEELQAEKLLPEAEKKKTPAKRTDPKLARVSVLAPGEAVPRRQVAA